MNIQWSILLGILFAFIIAVFAVINVDPVPVHYVFGTAKWPLVLVILGSVVMGAIIIATVGFVKIFSLKHENRKLEEELAALKNRTGISGGNANEKDKKPSLKKTAPDFPDGEG